jgi:hypothetical protein
MGPGLRREAGEEGMFRRFAHAKMNKPYFIAF